jgi:RNA polymerase sigma-70 factor, ECF subfamily
MLLTRDAELAGEIVQEAFVRAWQSSKSPHELPAFRRWLYRIIVNLVRDEQRRRRRLVTGAPIVAAVEDPVHAAESNFELSTLAAAFTRLTPRDQEVIYLRYLGDSSFKELAHILGKPEVAVRVSLHRALHRLRKMFASEVTSR